MHADVRTSRCWLAASAGLVLLSAGLLVACGGGSIDCESALLVNSRPPSDAVESAIRISAAAGHEAAAYAQVIGSVELDGIRTEWAVVALTFRDSGAQPILGFSELAPRGGEGPTVRRSALNNDGRALGIATSDEVNEALHSEIGEARDCLGRLYGSD